MIKCCWTVNGVGNGCTAAPVNSCLLVQVIVRSERTKLQAHACAHHTTGTPTCGRWRRVPLPSLLSPVQLAVQSVCLTAQLQQCALPLVISIKQRPIPPLEHNSSNNHRPIEAVQNDNDRTGASLVAEHGVCEHEELLSAGEFVIAAVGEVRDGLVLPCEFVCPWSIVAEHADLGEQLGTQADLWGGRG